MAQSAGTLFEEIPHGRRALETGQEGPPGSGVAVAQVGRGGFGMEEVVRAG